MPNVHQKYLADPWHGIAKVLNSILNRFHSTLNAPIEQGRNIHSAALHINIRLPLQSTTTTILKYTEYWSYVTSTHFLNKGGLSSFRLGSLCMISLWMMARRICRDLTSSSTWPCRSFSSISSSSLNEILWRDRNLWVVYIEDSLLTYLRNFS